MSGYGFRIPIEPVPGRSVATLRAVHRAIRAWLADSLIDNAPPMFSDWVGERFITVGDETPDSRDEDEDEDEDEGEDEDEDEFERDDAPRAHELAFNLTMVGYWPDELGDHLLKLAASNFVGLDTTLRRLGYRRVVRAQNWNEPMLPRWSEAHFGNVPRSRFASPLFLKLGDEDDDVPTNAHAILTTDGLRTYCGDDGESIVPATPIALASLTEIERARFDEYIAQGQCACAWCLARGVFSRWNARGRLAAPGWAVRAVDDLDLVLFLDEDVQLCWAVAGGPRAHLAGGVASHFYRSRDAGLNWELLDQAEHERAYVLQVAKVRRGAGWAIYAAVSDERAGAEDRWLCSLDQGLSYRDETGPLTTSAFNALQFFPCRARPEQIAVVTTDDDDRCRVHVSTTGGVSWGSSDVLEVGGLSVTEVSTVAFSLTEPDRLYAIFDCADASALKGQLVVSDDRGARWRRVDTVPPDGRVKGVVVGSAPGVVGVVGVLQRDAAASESRLLRSTDGGRTWTVTLTLEDIDGTGRVCSAGRGRWFCSTSDAGTYASSDDGQTWRLVSTHLNADFLDDDPADERGAYFASCGILVHVRACE